MRVITYTTARANLVSAMDRVCNDHEALIITRNGETIRGDARAQRLPGA